MYIVHRTTQQHYLVRVVLPPRSTLHLQVPVCAKSAQVKYILYDTYTHLHNSRQQGMYSVYRTLQYGRCTAYLVYRTSYAHTCTRLDYVDTVDESYYMDEGRRAVYMVLCTRYIVLVQGTRYIICTVYIYYVHVPCTCI